MQDFQLDNKNNENIYITHGDKINKYFIKYVTLINDFLNYAYNNLTIENIDVFKTNVQKGIQALTHIFKLILIKTNDINNAIDVTQRCFFYYIEFVTQISSSNDHIQLSLNDAIVFLYKKSIFQYYDKESLESTSNEITKNSCQYISLNLQKLIDIHNELLYYYISMIEYHNSNFNDFTKSIYIFTENFITINTYNNINNIYQFILYFKFNKINFIVLIKLINIFIKHICDKFVDSSNIFKKLIKFDIKNCIISDEKYNIKNTCKYILLL